MMVGERNKKNEYNNHIDILSFARRLCASKRFSSKDKRKQLVSYDCALLPILLPILYFLRIRLEAFIYICYTCNN